MPKRLTVLLLILLMACQTEPAKEPAHASPPPDPAELLQRWDNAWNGNDLEDLHLIVAENAILSLNGKLLPPAAHYLWMSESAALIKDLFTDAVYSNASGDIAYQTGTYSHGPLKDSALPPSHGTFTLIWERQQNGEWKVKTIVITGYRNAEAG